MSTVAIAVIALLLWFIWRQLERIATALMLLAMLAHKRQQPRR